MAGRENMALINEISENVYRISIYVKDFDMQFNHFLIKDDEPLLYHAGMKRMFPELKVAVSKIINPQKLKWISWSHFEVDEVSGLNQWLEVAPNAQPVCSLVGALVNLSDFSDREPKGMQKGESFETGIYRFTFHPTPHLPHGWDAGMLFEEKNKILFCSDLFHQMGDVEPIINSDVILERTNNAIVGFQSGPLMDYVPYTNNTKRLLNELAEFKPDKLAVMHGSSFEGDSSRLLKELDGVLKKTFE